MDPYTSGFYIADTLEDTLLGYVMANRQLQENARQFDRDLAERQRQYDATFGEGKRRYDTTLYANKIQLIKELMPQACIGVDVIVGFPGETEEEFNKRVKSLNDVNLSNIVEETDETDLSGELACAGGVCEITSL